MSATDSALNWPPHLSQWFNTHTYPGGSDCATVTKLKRTNGSRVAVIIPAFDEERAVGRVVSGLRDTAEAGVVDEIIVSIDAKTTDETAAIAREAGATVVTAEQRSLCDARHGGKAETMWRGLAATSADLVCFHDADLDVYTDNFVPNLLTPLLDDPKVQLVKGFYHRGEEPSRVSEFVVRPLLAELCPDLRGVIEPLGGEYAARRSLLSAITFSGGYGVDLGMLIDAYHSQGLDGLAQIDLGVRLGRPAWYRASAHHRPSRTPRRPRKAPVPLRETTGQRRMYMVPPGRE